MKVDGTIKINGAFVKTHAGHASEFRACASKNTILLEARKSQIINLLDRDELLYLTKIFNPEKRRDSNEMTAVATLLCN